MINHMHKLANVKVGDSNPIRIMGILNSSPESFYKKSIKSTKQEIKNSVKKMEIDGADFIDVGGMSTAPYLSTMISEKTESSRIANAIKIIQNTSNLPISVDTCRSGVAKIALDLGAEIINDISGLKHDPQMATIISKFNPSLILCAFHSKLTKGDINSTKKLLYQSLLIAKNAKIPSNRIVIDPAIGFFRQSGKNPFFTKIRGDWVKRDLSIIHNLKKLKHDNPVLISVSNKSFIGKLIEKEDPHDRLFGTIAAETISIINGADIIRTHNVSATKDVINIASNIIRRNKGL